MNNLKIAHRKILFGAIVSLTTVFGSVVFGQQVPPSIRRNILIAVANRPCDPAEVKQFSLGKQPLEAVLAQVKVRNASDKPIKSLTVGWRVYGEVESTKAAFESCESEPSAPVLASGSTDLIPVKYLEPKANVTIAINPLPVVNGTENQTAFIDRPLVTVDDLRPLIVDGKPVAPGKYGLVIFVSEVQYTDGTAWASPLR